MTLKQEILDIAETIKQAVPVEKIYLFGSHAYGTPDADSDYDFFLVLPDNGLRQLDALLKARKALPLKRETPVDILGDYKRRFNERKKFNTLERKIFREGVLLYEQSRYRKRVAANSL